MDTQRNSIQPLKKKKFHHLLSQMVIMKQASHKKGQGRFHLQDLFIKRMMMSVRDWRRKKSIITQWTELQFCKMNDF